MAKLKQPCKCIDQVQEQLAESNAALDLPLRINFKTGKQAPSLPLLVVHKLDDKKRQRLPSVICAHCPFCGIKYPE